MKIIVYRQKPPSLDQQERFASLVTNNELMTLLNDSAGSIKVHFMTDSSLIGDNKILVIFFDRGLDKNSKVVEIIREQSQRILEISDIETIIWEKENSWRAGNHWKQ